MPKNQNHEINISRQGSFIALAIPSKYGPPVMTYFEPDDARDLARGLFQLADEIDRSTQTAKIPPEIRRRAKILKLIENPKPENPK